MIGVAGSLPRDVWGDGCVVDEAGDSSDTPGALGTPLGKHCLRASATAACEDAVTAA